MMKKLFFVTLLTFSTVLLSSSVQLWGQTLNFTYTGAVQTYTVPCGVTTVYVDMAGGKGGNTLIARGGYGGRVTCSLAVTAGQVLYINVGGAGGNSTSTSTPGIGGYNGGGNGIQYAGGGGGASDIRIGGTALSNRVVVAGGGGGGSANYGTTDIDKGGAGGGLSGENGYSGYSDGVSKNTLGVGGFGGTQTTYGNGGLYPGYTAGGNGALGIGGNGASGGGYGAGGGGGLYGGGAGCWSGGGGGSSFTDGSLCTVITHTQGYNTTGNGYVTLVGAGSGFITSPGVLNFGLATIGTPSAPMTTTLSAASVTAGPLVITPPTGFQVSLDGSTWSSTAINYTYAGTSFSGVTLYVRVVPSAATTYTGSIGFSGGGISCSMNVSAVGVSPCSGTPTPGVAWITPPGGGASTPFSVNLWGTSVTGGLTYQWQSSTTSPTSGFTNIVGATNPTYSFTGISTTTYFQAIVTCPSFTPAISNTVAATFVGAFGYTGTIGRYVVPAGITSVNIIAKGAQGGNGSGIGGQGANMSGNFAVTPGQVLKYLVGQQPPSGTNTGGGGGGSFVWDSATSNLLIAGGGGGGGGLNGTTPQGRNATTDTNALPGMQGGSGAGVAGNGGTAGSIVYYAAGGAGWKSNGVNSNYTGCSFTATGGQRPLLGGAGGSFGGTSGSNGPGGFGGGGGSQGRCGAVGGGGGGGYSGGGPGGDDNAGSPFYSGGGGSSFNGGTAQFNTVGNTGNGVVTITPLGNCSVPYTQPTSFTSSSTLFTIAASFTNAIPTPLGYLVIMTTTSTPPTNPSDGTMYALGDATLGGVVVSNDNSTSFNLTGMTPGTTRYFWIFSYNGLCAGAPKYLTTSPLTGSASTLNCSLSGVRTIGPTGTYPSIAAALSACTAYGVSGTLALELQTTYTGETYPIQLGSGYPCLSETNNIIIRPQGTMTLSASVAGPLFYFNGTRYITIDGRVGSTGTTKALTLINTNTLYPVIGFINDAMYDTVKYCIIKSNNTSTATSSNQMGAICFGNTTGTYGNDFNTIESCDITTQTVGGSQCVGIYSYGTSNKENSYNTISNCNIYDYYYTGYYNYGIWVNSYNNGWIIRNNRFYQTATRSLTGCWYNGGIYVSPGTTGLSGGFRILNNIIGYASNTGSGTYTTTSSTCDYFRGIWTTVNVDTPTIIYGNTISGLNITEANSATTSGGAVTGIYHTSGSANIDSNVIGAATGTGSIVGNMYYGGTVVGISTSANNPTLLTPALVNIRKNIIGSITANNVSTTYGASVHAIQASSNASVVISNNIIGSTTTANSIQVSANVAGSSYAQYVYGINSQITTTVVTNPLISNNIIANLYHPGLYSSNLAAGIVHASGAAGVTIKGNTIYNISAATPNSVFSTQLGVTGITCVPSSTTPTAIIDSNTIYNIANINTAANYTHVAGILFANATDASISRNKVYDIRNASTYNGGTTAPPTATGLFIYGAGGSTTNALSVVNNMITLGTGQTTNTSFTGIMAYGSSSTPYRVYHNSVLIEGTAPASATNHTTAFHRGGYNTTNTNTIDVRNNIFANNRTNTSGTASHYAIANGINYSVSSSGWNSDYNLLNTANSATVGWFSGAARTFATWKTTALADFNSGSAGALTFTNPAVGDLHINMGTTANMVESHGTNLPAVNADFDSDVRPGPTGSVNGGGFAPDLGADEFDGNPLDNIPPAITYTPLLAACGTGDRTFTAVLADPSGVPTTGSLVPRVYFKKSSSGTWLSAPGTLSTGSATSGTWSFTIVASSMGGLALNDVVQYFVIAQDNNGYVGSNTSGIQAGNVNSISTYPSVPPNYTVLLNLGGPYTVGSGGAYTTITSAVQAYNTACLSGPVTFNLISTSYPSETYPILITGNSFASATNTLTIRPATGTAVTINGPATPNSIFKLQDAKWVILDGIRSGGASLTLNSTYTSTFANVWVSSTNATISGCRNLTLRNMDIVGGTNTSTNFGILASYNNGGSATPTTSSGLDNDSVTVTGNRFSKLYYGMYLIGTAVVSAGGLNDWNISGNTFGPAAYSATDNIYQYGIYMTNMLAPQLTNNTFQNIGLTTASTQTAGIYMPSNVNYAFISNNNIGKITSFYCTSTTGANCGIYVGSSVQNATIVKNLISNIDNVSTSGCGVSAGILLTTSQTVSNILIANNMISDIKGKGWSGYSYFPAGIAIHNATGGIKIYHNSINLFGNYPGYATNTGSAALLVNSSSNNIDVRNNIFRNSYDNTTNGSDKGYAIYSTQTSGATFSNINYNDYFVSGPNVMGYLSSDKTTVAQLQTSFGGNMNSINVPPLFVDTVNLRLQVVPDNVPFLVGAPLSQVTVDIDDTLRSTINPVIGAHEVKIPPCNTVVLNAGNVTPGTPVLCTQGVTDLVPVGATSALNLTYQWLRSDDSTSWTPISGATSRNYSIQTPISVSTYYRLRLGCATNGMFDSAAKRVIVNPSRVMGDSVVCEASSITLTDSTASGVWSSASTLIASVVGSTGTVTGVAAGTVRITYMVGGCYATKQITVNPLPANIFGVQNVCEGATTTLINTTGGGAWSSGTTPVATIATSGVVSGVSAGIANITYQLPTTCLRQVAVSVNPVPIMSVSPSSAAVVCQGDSASFRAQATLPQFSLLNQNFNSGLGLWTANLVSGPASSNWYITSSGYNSTTGDGSPFLVSTPEVSGGGNTVLTSPSFSTVGYGNATLTYNQDIVSVSSDDITVAVQYSTNNGSTWNPLDDQMDVISETYTWTAATPQVTVALPLAALGQPNVKLRWVYNTTFGFYWAIDNIAVKAALPDPTYSWTAFAPASGLACATAGCDSVKIAPSMLGVNLYSVTATTASGCVSTGGLTSVLVNPVPGSISGIKTVCEGATTTLGNAAFGGSWSSGNASIASVNISNGVVTGVAAGTVDITYSMPTGCRSVTIVTVNGTPAPITGVMNVCTGFTTSLATMSSVGTWSSSASAIASVDAVSGVVTGNNQGTATISYTNSFNCFSVGNVVVNQYPAAITASSFEMCEGQTVNLSSATLGGTWSSSNAATATVSAGSGIVTGVAAAGTVPGIATISYTLPGCIRTQDVSVNPTPASITGDVTICQTEVSTLASATPGGVWALSPASVASIDIATGAVTGSNAGTATVTYLMGTGCKTSTIVTVNTLPGAITGTLDVCQDLTTTLSNSISGGAWTSDNMATAAISGAGVILGGAAGTANITYSLPTGCYRTDVATVNATPDNITGTFQLCQGDGTMLSSSPAGGTWSSSAPGTASIDLSTGAVTASSINSGTASVTYTLPTGCKVSENITVHQLPPAISGILQVCETKTTTLSNSLTGGTWGSADAGIAGIDAMGVVTGNATGTTLVTYTMSTGCYRTAAVSVNTQPSAITGTTEICQGAGTALTSMPTGGVWVSSVPGIASVDPVTGAVTASSINSGTAQVVYTLPMGCQTATDITVDPLPAPIAGIFAVCEGSTTNLTSATPGGTWSVSNTNATINAAGTVTGGTAGTTDVVYEFSTGCSQSAVVTIHQTPAPITGASDVCQTAVTTLSSATPGGTWAVGSTYIATIDAGTGELTGMNSGGTSVTYALPTGCNSTSNITVNQLPNAIAGTLRVCETFETTLSNTVGGGTWMSDDIAKASITAAGVVTGNATGTANITYTLSTGCYRSDIVTVNVQPSAITGTFAVCQNESTPLSCSPAGGAWTSSIAAVATIDASGVVTASSSLSGISHIVYTTPEGCYSEADMLVNPLPAPIVGPSTVCETSTATLTNTSAGGVWGADASGFATVDATTGVVTGVAAGTTSVTYTLIATGCQRAADVTVLSTPAPITGTMAVCQGATTTLSSLTSGGTWSSVIPSVATISSTGIVSGIITGFTSVDYTLATGCKQTAVVSVNSLPTSYPVSGGGAYCAGGAGVNIGMLTSDAGIHYQLYNGSATMGGVAAGTGTGFNFGLQTVPGTYTVTAINYATGCTKAMFGTATISIIPTVIPAVTLASSAGTSLCGGTSSTFSATPVGGGTLPAYSWTVNSTPVMGVTSSSYSYVPANGDVVSVTLTSSAACADPVTALDMITMSVTTPVVPSATIAGASNVCAGTPTTMTATPVNGGTTPAWQWSLNGGVIAGATNSTYSFVPTAGDFVNCSMATSISCNTAPMVNSNTIALLTTPVIVPTVSISVSPGVVIPFGTPATFTAMATSAGAAPTFQWFKNGVAIGGATLNTYTSSTIANGDSITCRVTATEECGKETFNSVLMSVKGNSNSVAVHNMAGDIMLVPNPNTGDFVIKGRVTASDDEVITVDVTNVLGQTVYSGTLTAKDGQINGRIRLANDLANGMYMLNLKNVEVQKSLRFVLER